MHDQAIVSMDRTGRAVTRVTGRFKLLMTFFPLVLLVFNFSHIYIVKVRLSLVFLG